MKKLATFALIQFAALSIVSAADEKPGAAPVQVAHSSNTYTLDVYAPSTVFSGSNLYVEIWPNYTFTPRQNFYLDSVLLNGAAVANFTDYCSSVVCPQDPTGRFFNYNTSTTFLIQIPAASKYAPGNYTLSIKVELAGAAQTVTLPLQIMAAPAATPQVSLPSSSVPKLSKWQTSMTTLATKWCPAAGFLLNLGDDTEVWYYDGGRVYWQIQAYTNNSTWNNCALRIESQYKDWVLSRNGEIPGYQVFPRGLRLAYQKTHDSSYLQALNALATNSAYAAYGGDADQAYIRETAYILETYMEAELAGEPRNPLMARAVDFLIADFNELFVSGTYQINQTFFDGLAAEALIDYYQLTGDPRIAPTIKLMLDWMWNVGWNKSTQSLVYNPDPVGPKCDELCQVDETEMINLIVPAFGWYWNVTGNSQYQREGDEMFSHALDTDITYDGKIFTQNYRWSIDYVTWRTMTKSQMPN